MQPIGSKADLATVRRGAARSRTESITLSPGCMKPLVTAAYPGSIAPRPIDDAWPAATRGPSHRCREHLRGRALDCIFLLPHPSGEWPKNITIRILLSVRILIEFRPQCPGSIHYWVCGEKGLPCRLGGRDTWGCSMASWDEEMFTMMGGLAVIAVFCIAGLLWLV